jgi:hypothetical protein
MGFMGGSTLLRMGAVLLVGMVLHLRADNSTSNAVASTVRAVPGRGIENFYHLSDRFYSGAAPEGDAAFAELRKLGVKTIITVDGALHQALISGYTGQVADGAFQTLKGRCAACHKKFRN